MNLDPKQLPTAEPAFASRAPQRPLRDLGPKWIDAETVELLGQRLAGGLVSFPPETEKVIADLDAAVVNQAFADHLHESLLPGSGYAIEVRVLALTNAIRALVAARTAPIGTDGVQIPEDMDAKWSLTQLELHYQVGLTNIARLLQMDRTDPVVKGICDLALTISPADLSKIAGIPLGTLAAWRYAGKGPKFLQISPRNVQYPVATFIEWIYGMLS